MAKAKKQGVKMTPDGWEIRSRLYELTRGKAPLVFTVKNL